ncbi:MULTISPECIES: NADPH-dependent FMN reductase [Burkholderia cepacia complex]|uniref:NADPH-dependent FMN reductase n=1 Tax=Burkholderia cepacia complex TaxID=87882 RepID=UPI001CF5768C|nr:MULTISPECIES: NAD(P)H-dependent oxidoreductase [Burkholderia cepacia complex]MCA8057338.1 NAD(P)H-dependent oxidoreductase [Burkholderia cepacia]MDN7531323.1 NAD(P)H-dependent oxidoreductase [Burkholderia orbicola]
MASPNILVFAASTRSGSLNQQLASVVTGRIERYGGSVTNLDLAKYPLPIYDGDLEATDGVPAAAIALHEQLRGHDGIFIASPEYNSSVGPLLVNLLAWTSRITAHGGVDAAFGKPVFAIGSASPGGFGGYRGLMALRQILELQFMARVLPAMVSVPSAHTAFDESGQLRNEVSSALVDKIAKSLVALATAEA